MDDMTTIKIKKTTLEKFKNIERPDGETNDSVMNRILDGYHVNAPTQNPPPRRTKEGAAVLTAQEVREILREELEMVTRG